MTVDRNADTLAPPRPFDPNEQKTNPRIERLDTLPPGSADLQREIVARLIEVKGACVNAGEALIAVGRALGDVALAIATLEAREVVQDERLDRLEAAE